MDADPESMRRVGQALADYVKSLERPSGYSVASLQAVAADLLATSSADLLILAKDIIARPGFGNLAEQAGSGKGSIYRDAMINELSTLYRNAALTAINECLNGFLALPAHDLPKSGRVSEPDQKEDVYGARRSIRSAKKTWTFVPLECDNSGWRQTLETSSGQRFLAT